MLENIKIEVKFSATDDMAGDAILLNAVVTYAPGL